MRLKNRKGFIIIVIAVILLIIGVTGSAVCMSIIIDIRDFNLDPVNINKVAVSVGSSLDSAASIIEGLSTALRNGSLTVKEVKESLYNVADISGDTTGVIQSIAEAMDFNIFGFQPLSEASEYFESVGENINQLGGNITDIADNMDINADDIVKIADDLESLSSDVREISYNFENAFMTLPDFGIKKILYAFFSFCCLLSFGFILTGISIILVNRKINLYLVSP